MKKWCDACHGWKEQPHDHAPNLFDMVAEEHEALMRPDQNQVGKAQLIGQSDTSKIAALQALPRSGTQRDKVLQRVGQGGCTDEQMQHDLGMNPSTQRPRRVELVEGAWIMDSGVRRRTSSGRDAVVWCLTLKGREALS